jgi:hypothetical protein
MSTPGVLTRAHLLDYETHFVTVDTACRLKGKTAEIRSFKNGSTEEVPLIIPTTAVAKPGDDSIQHPELLPLYTKKFIQHLLLTQGFVPKLEGKKVKLRPPMERGSIDPTVQSKLQMLCDELTKENTKEPVCDLLKEFREAITNAKTVKDLTVAQQLIEAIIEKDSKENIRRIQAFFYSLQQDYNNAVAIYLSVGDMAFKRGDTDQAASDYEGALHCNPSSEGALRNLEELFGSNSDRVKNYYLYVYLQTKHAADSMDELCSKLKTKNLTNHLEAKAKAMADSAQRAFDAAKLNGDNPLLALADPEASDEQAICNARKLLEKPKESNPVKVTRERRSTLASPMEFMKSLSKSPTKEKDSDAKTHRSSRDSTPGPQRNPSPRNSGASSAAGLSPIISARHSSAADAPSPGSLKLVRSPGEQLKKLKGLVKGGSKEDSTPVQTKGLEVSSPTPIQKEVDPKNVKYDLGLALKTKIKGNIETKLTILWSHYVKKENWRKAEIIAKLMFDRLGDMNSILKYAEALRRNNKVAEGAELIYRNIIQAYESNKIDDIPPYFSKLNAIDKNWASFDATRQRTLCLLSSASPENLELEPSPRETKKEGFLGPNAFFMDHPQFLACYTNGEQIFLIGTREAWVETPSKGISKPHMLELETPLTLSRKESIQNYIQMGYVPEIVDGVVKFQVRKEDLGHFKSRADSILKSSPEEPRVKKALKEFLKILDNSPTLAQEALKRFADSELLNKSLSESSASAMLLYADFLFARKKLVRAGSVYFSLGQKIKDPEKKRVYLTRAYVCFPNEKYDAALADLTKKEDEKSKYLRYLTAYLLSSGQNDACYQKSAKDPLMQLAKLNKIPVDQKIERIRIYTALAKIYEASNVENQYYEKCILEFNCDNDLKNGIKDILNKCRDTPTMKRAACKILDGVLRRFPDQAARAFTIIFKVFKNRTSHQWYVDWEKDPHGYRFDGETGSLGRRELAILSLQNDLSGIEKTTKRLLYFYTDKKKFEKAYAVALFAFKKGLYFERECIGALKKQTKIKEAARCAVDCAYTLIRKKKLYRASEMIKELNQLDPKRTSFKNEERFMISLMEEEIKKWEQNSEPAETETA